MLSKPILLNNFKRAFSMNEDYILNESLKNGEFGEKNEFTWIYDAPFKTLTIQEQGHKTDSKFKELEVKGILDKEAKSLIDILQSEDDDEMYSIEQFNEKITKSICSQLVLV